RNQVALVKSHLVLSLALDDPEVARFGLGKSQEIFDWLEEELQVDFSLSPEILRIALTTAKAELAVALVGAITRAYLGEIVDSREKRRLERLQKLSDLRKRHEEKLKANREAQQQMEGKAGHRDAGVRALMLGFLQQQLGMNEKELLQTQADLRKA